METITASMPMSAMLLPATIRSMSISLSMAAVRSSLAITSASMRRVPPALVTVGWASIYGPAPAMCGSVPMGTAWPTFSNGTSFRATPVKESLPMVIRARIQLLRAMLLQATILVSTLREQRQFLMQITAFISRQACKTHVSVQMAVTMHSMPMNVM